MLNKTNINHSSGSLLLSLQSAMPIQTERSDERVKNRTENSLLLIYYVFDARQDKARQVYLYSTYTVVIQSALHKRK